MRRTAQKDWSWQDPTHPEATHTLHFVDHLLVTWRADATSQADARFRAGVLLDRNETTAVFVVNHKTQAWRRYTHSALHGMLKSQASSRPLFMAGPYTPRTMR